MSQKNRHLLSINDLTKDEIINILNLAQNYEKLVSSNFEIPPILHGKVVSNIFFQENLQTQLSFEMAAKRLGASFVNFQEFSSEKSKGNHLTQTMKTFDSLVSDISIICHPDFHYLNELKDKIKFKIINAGAGNFEHPTQSLIELYTLFKHHHNFTNASIAIYGDIRSSMGMYCIKAFKQIRNNISICTSLQSNIKFIQSDNSLTLISKENALKTCDMHIFIQSESEEDQLMGNNISLTLENINKIREGAFFTSPGPLISNEVILNHPKSKILEQLKNSLFVSMAVLDWINS